VGMFAPRSETVAFYGSAWIASSTNPMPFSPSLPVFPPGFLVSPYPGAPASGGHPCAVLDQSAVDEHLVDSTVNETQNADLRKKSV
jgi:hypothetical protein